MALEFKYNSGCKLGTFLSDQIKVISKASKAKNFTKNPDFKYLAVSSGQYVSYFKYKYLSYSTLFEGLSLESAKSSANHEFYHGRRGQVLCFNYSMESIENLFG